MKRSWLVLALALVAPIGALASPAVGPEPTPGATLRVHAARVVVAAGPDPDVWTYSFEVSGRGEGRLRVEGDEARLDPARASALAALAHASAPRLVERPAWDPCLFGFARYARIPPPTPERTWPFGPEGWTAAWPAPREPTLGADRVRLEATSGGAARLRVRPTAEPRWTPPLRVRRPLAARDAAAFGALGALAPPGRLLELELFTLGAGAGLAPQTETFPLPTKVALPEVSYEHPLDTRRAIIRHTRVVEGPDAIVQSYRGRAPELDAAARLALEADEGGVVSRFALAFGKSGRPPLALGAPPPGAELLAPMWFIHRVWRAPLFCDARGGYLVAVARQQANVHRTFSVMTGRPLDAVVALSRERGYLLEPFAGRGARGPDEVSVEPVAIDRSAWSR